MYAPGWFRKNPVQGADLVCRLKFQGRATKSGLVLAQAVHLAQNMRLFDAPAISQDKTLSEMDRIRTITAWGIYNLSSCATLSIIQPHSH